MPRRGLRCKVGTSPRDSRAIVRLQDNWIWDTGADGFVTRDPVTGFPTTTGYDLTTGWGSPWAPGYLAQLTAH